VYPVEKAITYESIRDMEDRVIARAVQAGWVTVGGGVFFCPACAKGAYVQGLMKEREEV
jgi:hypothetical protein